MATIADLRRELEARAHTFALEMERAEDPEWGRPGFWLRFRSYFSEQRCGPLDDVAPEVLLLEMQGFDEFMPADAPHGPQLDALWESYRRYTEAGWDLLQAFADACDAEPDNHQYDGLRAALIEATP